MSVKSQLEELFFAEARRHLETARAEIVHLEDGAVGARAHECYRALHSLKGMAASMGLDDLVGPSHAAEDRLKALRDGEQALDAGVRDELTAALDRLGTLLAAAERTAASRDEREPVEALQVRMPPVRVAAERLDTLTDLVARLATAEQRLEHRLGPPEDPVELQARSTLAHVVGALSRELVDLRLIPVSSFLPVLRGAVQRWADERDVPVELEIREESLRLDRSLIERLFDALGHLLRNAVVHGVTPAERGGPIARIRVSVDRDGDRVRAEVRDEGPGLDPAAVARRAVTRGVCSETEAAALDPTESLLLLTHPEMAAARRADHLAGRGVGLAAARRAVNELGGELRLESVPGDGFRAALLVPVRLTIQEAFVVVAGGSTFAVPVGNVREIRDAWNIPDDIDAPVSLAHALGIRGGDTEARTALIVEGSGVGGALLVSRVEDRREIVVRPLGVPLEGISPWVGATPLREGGLALVVDPVRLLRDARRAATHG